MFNIEVDLQAEIKNQTNNKILKFAGPIHYTGIFQIVCRPILLRFWIDYNSIIFTSQGLKRGEKRLSPLAGEDTFVYIIGTMFEPAA